MTNNKLPRISIVTPSYNQSFFLEHTIKSVLSQGYPELEYIVIDGGSNDGSIDIIKKYEDDLAYWVSEKDEGHGHALNKGFSRSTGEIMAWINSDDMYPPWSFSTVAEIFRKFPHVMWISGTNSTWNTNGAIVASKTVTKNIYDFLLGKYRWLQQESIFWRRGLWENAGGYINQDYKFMVDGELWSRFFLHEPLYNLSCIVGGYRKHGHNRALHNGAECHREMRLAIAEMRKQCSPDVIEVYKKLHFLQQFNKNRLTEVILNRVGPRLRPSAYDVAAYNHIKWDNSEWKESKLVFSV